MAGQFFGLVTLPYPCLSRRLAAVVHEQIDILDATVARSDGGLRKVRTAAEIVACSAAGSVGYTLPLADQEREFFSVLTVQYVGSSYSQFENEEPNFGSIGSGLPNSARLIGYGNPPAGTTFSFDPLLPSYALANIRAGLRTERWETAVYLNNITDKEARLALDYERGRSARVSYLTNQPRTIGVSALYRF